MMHRVNSFQKIRCYQTPLFIQVCNLSLYSQPINYILTLPGHASFFPFIFPQTASFGLWPDTVWLYNHNFSTVLNTLLNEAFMFVGAAQLRARHQQKACFLHTVLTLITFHSFIVSDHVMLGWALDWIPVHHRLTHIHLHTHSHIGATRIARNCHSTNWRVFKRWEETREPKGNQHKNRENMQNSI